MGRLVAREKRLEPIPRVTPEIVNHVGQRSYAQLNVWLNNTATFTWWSDFDGPHTKGKENWVPVDLEHWRHVLLAHLEAFEAWIPNEEEDYP